MSKLHFSPAAQRRRKYGVSCLVIAAPPACAGGTQGIFMVCYQVLVQFAFCNHKAFLVSTSQKQIEAKSFLVTTGLPFGRGLKYRRFFATEKEAVRYTAHLHSVYANRTISNPALSGGQLLLF
jgi:hypothetical protein